MMATERSGSTRQRQFGSRPPRIQESLCLNSRFRATGCRRCVHSCPTGAIDLASGHLSLDPDRCVHCGACLQVCPTEAFQGSTRPETILVRTVGQLSDGPVGLICPLHPHPGLTRLPVSTLARHSRCLAALSPLQLLALARDGTRPLWLDDLACAGCPIGQATATLAASLAVANRLLAVAGQRGRLYLASTQDGDLRAEPAACTPLDGQDPHYSRRGLFAALGQRVREEARAAQEKDRQVPATEQAEVGARLPHHIPSRRRQLSAWLARMLPPAAAKEPVDLAGLPFAQVTVDSNRCSGCGLCARFCPTGALAFDADEGEFRLQFQATVCLDCGICQTACPEDAIGLEDCVPGEALATGGPQPLVAGELVKCAACGTLTAVRPGDEGPAHCYVCRRGARLTAMTDHRGELMADLLIRMSGGDAPR